MYLFIQNPHPTFQHQGNFPAQQAGRNPYATCTTSDIAFAQKHGCYPEEFIRGQQQATGMVQHPQMGF